LPDKFEKIEEQIERLLERDREKEKRIKDEEYYKVRQLAFDNRTVRSLLKLFNKGVLEDLTWVISAGKESLVLAGRGPEGELAIKIYRIYTANFKKYLDYIIGDHRFPPVRDRDKIIPLWAKKEFRNLKRLRDVEVNVPRPIDVTGNILVMQFIGEEGVPAPLLKEVVDLENPRQFLDAILNDIRKAYVDGDLVHGDLSEYNVMVWRSKHWIIDVSQAVVTAHPLSFSFLLRDLERITSFFKKRYRIEVPDPYKLAEDLAKVKEV